MGTRRPDRRQHSRRNSQLRGHTHQARWTPVDGPAGAHPGRHPPGCRSPALRRRALGRTLPLNRMLLVLPMLVFFHGIGLVTRERFDALATAMHAVGTVSAGAAIALIGQIFNMQEHWPAAVLLWALCAAAGCSCCATSSNKLWLCSSPLHGLSRSGHRASARMPACTSMSRACSWSSARSIWPRFCILASALSSASSSPQDNPASHRCRHSL